MTPMHHSRPKASEADVVSREHLVTLLIAQVERTFTTEGSNRALFELGNLLRRLDESTLRALVHWQGAADEDDMTEPGPEDAGGDTP